MNSVDGLNQKFLKLKEDMARLEAEIAGSWALKSRHEYEVGIREGLKSELSTYAAKIAIAAVIFVGGVGAIFIKSVIIDVYQSHNEKAISDVRSRYEQSIKSSDDRFEWKKNHDYGKNYIYLSDMHYFFYKESANNSVDNKIEFLMDRSRMYFELAIKYNPGAASTYFELAEINYTYPLRYNIKSKLNQLQAIFYYEQAVRLYTDDEIGRGWRGGALLRIAEIKLSRITGNEDSDNLQKRRIEIRQLLMNAHDDFRKMTNETREYYENDIKRSRELLGKVSAEIGS